MDMQLVVRCRNVGTLYPTGYDEDPDRLGGILVDRLDIAAGGVVAIMGPSGSGKSTLLSLLSGLKGENAVSASDGASELTLLPGTADAADLLAHDVPRAGSVGFVFQDSHLMKSLSVALNTDMARVLTHPGLDRDTFAALMRDFGLVRDAAEDGSAEALRQTPVATLSGGQQQRVAVARALAAEPRLIFCDEPTSSLDPKTAHRIMTRLRDWARGAGATVLWVTHDEDLALRIADAILCVADGRVLADGGRPRPLPPEADTDARRALLEDLRRQARDLPALTRDLIAEGGMVLDPTARQRSQANGGTGAPVRRAHFNLIGIAHFILRFVLAELFPARTGRTRQPGALRGLALPLRFSRPTFALIVLLGILAAYATLFGLGLLDAKFARDLSRPEVSHYTLERFGDVASGADDLLSLRALRRMEDDLAQRFAAQIERGARSPQVFGRRLELSARTADLRGGCDDARTRAGNAVLVVFDHDEPLFRDLTVTGGGSIGAIDAADLPGKVFVTADFLQRRLGIGPGDPVPDAFCLGSEKNLARVEIAGLLRDIPGSRVLSAEIAMTNDAWLRMMKEPDMRPNSWGSGWPPFESAALYFDAEYAEPLFCTIDECESRPELFDRVYGPSYKLNDDALAQVRRLLSIALGSRQLLIAVVLSMAVSIGIAVALSVQAFIASNERFLSIMRAVGYRLGHIALLMVAELMVITLVAAAVAVAVLAALHGVFADDVARIWDLEPEWLAWSPGKTVNAIRLAFYVVAGVGLCVVGWWWASHRHVGQKLQGV